MAIQSTEIARGAVEAGTGAEPAKVVANAAAPTSTSDDSPRMSPAWIRFFGWYHAILAITLLYLLVKVWPSSMSAKEGDTVVVDFFCGWIHRSVSPEVQVVLLVVLASSLGSYVHGATSFVNFTGDRKIDASWRWWYFLRPFIGMALGLGFYFAMRAGFFTVSAGTTSLNLVGFTAASFLVGMFTKQATEKLTQMFDVLFGAPDKYKPEEGRLTNKV